MLKGRRRVGALILALALGMPLAFAGQAAAADYTNACRNSVVGTNWDQVDVSMNGTAAPAGNTLKLTNLAGSMAVPGTVFVAGYNLGLLTAGPNSIPATVHSIIDAAGTSEGSQSTSDSNTTISTTITDPNGTPGDGDESATPGTANVSYADQTWTPSAPGVIGFHEHDDQAITGATGGGIIAIAHIAAGGGTLNVQFHCTSGTVAGSMPGVPTFSNAPIFASVEVSAAQVAAAQQCASQRAALQKKIKKAKKAGNKKKVKKLKKKLRKLAC
jgi:hypothetical protein